jgi:hypothetical protein
MTFIPFFLFLKTSGQKPVEGADNPAHATILMERQGQKPNRVKSGFRALCNYRSGGFLALVSFFVQ